MLQTKEAWEAWIAQLKLQEQISELSKEEIVDQLAKLIEKVIVKLSQQQTEIGLLFSGGVDSTIIGYVLQKNNVPFTAIAIGFWDENQKEPEDVIVARKVAQDLNFDYHEKFYSFEEVEQLFQKTVRILGKELSNTVSVGVGSVEIAGIEQLHNISSEIRAIYGGLGSEEIYAGYHRHAKAVDVHEECWNGINSMFERDILRDIAISKAYNISFCTPFLDEGIIKYSMNIPHKYKLTETTNKVILRESAIALGLPEKYAMRPKKAAQYGSRIDNALEKIAKQKGYQFKNDYVFSLVSQLTA